MTCSTCSGQMNAGERFCSCCGRLVDPVTQVPYAEDRLVRPRFGRMMGGVCAAIAQREGWDVALVRLVAVVCFLGGFGMVAVAYIAAWFIIPNEPLWNMQPGAPPSGAVPPAGAVAS